MVMKMVMVIHGDDGHSNVEKTITRLTQFRVNVLTYTLSTRFWKVRLEPSRNKL